MCGGFAATLRQRGVLPKEWATVARGQPLLDTLAAAGRNLALVYCQVRASVRFPSTSACLTSTLVSRSHYVRIFCVCVCVIMFDVHASSSACFPCLSALWHYVHYYLFDLFRDTQKKTFR